MKQITAVALVLLLAQFLLPVLLIRSEPIYVQKPQAEQPQPEHTQPEQLKAVVPVRWEPQGPEQELQDSTQTLSVLWEDGKIRVLPLADYLWGVVAAEMPASFEMEALKAQAVAARTYCTAEETAFRAAHPLARVCTDSTCCQAFATREEAMSGWGEQAQEYAERIGQAVEQTDGLGVCYQGRAIQALYFSSAPGQTVDAHTVWSQAVPYLVSVASPEGDEVPDYHAQFTLAAKEVRTLIQARYPQAKLSGKPTGWFTDFVRDSGGTVVTVKVGGVTLKGGEVRKLLGLRSACFTLSVAGEQMTFRTTGYGHGVGMSQYGANALAREGKTFREILEWYYTGALVEPLWQAGGQ